MASVHNSVVSTIVLMLISKRELDPLAIFRAFVKIEMQMAPFMDKRQADRRLTATQQFPLIQPDAAGNYFLHDLGTAGIDT